jgi:signal transduction histidine kinase
MPSLRDNDASARTDASDDAYANLRRQQLLIIRQTSIPGISIGGPGILLVLWAAFYWTDSVQTRNAYLGIVISGLLLIGLWARALWHCSRNDLQHAFLAQFAAVVIASTLLILFIQGGIAMALVTAFTGLSAAAALLDARTLRISSIVMSVAVLLAAALHGLQVVPAIAMPPALLYGASAVAIVAAFRTPITALSMLNAHLKASRGDALHHAQAAERARLNADRQARNLLKLSEELRDFTYVISHDLRAPLINIEGFAAALGDTLDDFSVKLESLSDADSAATARELWNEARGEAAEAMHFINGGTKKLNALVVGLLELSRLDSKPPQEKAVELTPLLAQIVASLQHQIRERDIAVRVAPLPTVVADPLRVSQVFSNLIDNAIKYMPERAPREISVSCVEEDDQYVFAIADSGDGISAENRAKVFRPFKRLDPKSSPAGEGLGLAAVRKIIDRQGGRIWIEDTPSGQGVCFRFSWQRTTLPTESTAEAECDAAEPGTPPSARSTSLPSATEACKDQHSFAAC